VWNWLYLEEAGEQERLESSILSQEDEEGEEDSTRTEKSVSVQFRQGQLSKSHRRLHCKNSTDYMPERSGSMEWAGLKMYLTFHQLHALLM